MSVPGITMELVPEKYAPRRSLSGPYTVACPSTRAAILPGPLPVHTWHVGLATIVELLGADEHATQTIAMAASRNGRLRVSMR